MMMMHRIFALFWILVLTSSLVIAVPLYTQHKRQSDQRLAELETLLALHKYGVSPRRVGGRNSAGYGLIDFNYIGRRKKSASAPGDEDISAAGGIYLPGLMMNDQQLQKVHPLVANSHRSQVAGAELGQSVISSADISPSPPAGSMQNLKLSSIMHNAGYME